MHTNRTRDPTIDIARGLAIIAIVAGHVLRGLTDVGLIGKDAAFLLSDRGIYMFHLTIFAFLAGLFVRSGVGKAGAPTYLRQRVASFTYLYLLWTFLTGLLGPALAGRLDLEKPLHDVLEFWVPKDQYWFLPWLICMTLLAVIARPWESRSRTFLGLGGALGLSLALWAVNGQVIGTQGFGLTVFFFAGVVVGAGPFTAAVAALTPARTGVVFGAGLALYLGLLLAGATPPTIGGNDRTVLSVAAGFVAAYASAAAVIAVSRLLSRVRTVGPLLAFTGQRSMEIFLAHSLAVAATRNALTGLGITTPATHLVVGTVVSVLVPLAVWLLARRLDAGWLFAAPAWLTPTPDDSAARARMEPQTSVSR